MLGAPMRYPIVRWDDGYGVADRSATTQEMNDMHSVTSQVRVASASVTALGQGGIIGHDQGNSAWEADIMSKQPLNVRPTIRQTVPWYRRWRTAASFLAALVILHVMIHHGLFGRTEDGGVQWSHVVVYLCGAIVFALQADRLFHRLK